MRSAVRTSTAAYWASWADTMPMLAERCERLAQTCRSEFERGNSTAASVREGSEARRALLTAGYHSCPTWEAVWHGERPPLPEETEPGEYIHGWQYHASSRFETTYREEELEPLLGGARTALLRSQAGPCAGVHLTALPLQEETKWEAAQLRVLLLRRLRLSFPLGPGRCRCGQTLDNLGDHRAACGNCGVLQTRAVPLERMWRRVCREAGGRLLSGYLRDLNLGGVAPTDDRRLECVVTGLSLHNGA